MLDDFDVLEPMVIDDECVNQHEHRFRYSQRVFELAFGLGFKMLYAVVRDETDGATCKCRNFWYLDIFVHR